MRRGEIWWGEPALPGIQRKRRPFLIVSHDAFNTNERWTKVMAVHLTTVVRAGAARWEVQLPRGAGGMRKASVAKCAEVYTLFKDELDEPLGTLPRELMGHVDAALALALALP